MELRTTLGFILLQSLNKLIQQRIKGKQKEWNRIHEKKLTKLFKDATPETTRKRPHNVVHNFSSYELSVEEHHLLTYGLDHHIPVRMNENEIKTEFEAFFYGLNKQLKHL